MSSKFQEELSSLINHYSMENPSSTPDFLLAEYISDCLRVYAKVIQGRDKWYGFESLSRKYEGKIHHIDGDQNNNNLENLEIKNTPKEAHFQNYDPL